MWKETYAGRQLDRKYATILGIKVDSTSVSQVLSRIMSKLQKNRQFYVVTPNPEIVLQAQNDPKLAAILNGADISLPDGVGLVWAGRVLGEPAISPVPGRKIMTALFALAEKNHYRVFLFGATPRVIEKSLAKLTRGHPNLAAAGFSGPKLTDEAEPVTLVDSQLQIDSVEKINDFEPDILFVALGCPKQEKWIAKNRLQLKAKCLITVGGGLDYYSGLKKLPPQKVERAGLEWLWRLIREPARIGRIANAVVVFPIKVLFSILGLKQSR